MGQSSSQAAPSQVQEAQGITRSHEVARSTKSLSRAATMQKRSRSSAEDMQESLPQTKKTRVHHNDVSITKVKSRCSMPQHRRGTAMLPTEDISENNAGNSVPQVQARPADLRKSRPGSAQSSVNQRSHADLEDRLENDVVIGGDTQKGAVAMNRVGKPGPRKRERMQFETVGAAGNDKAAQKIQPEVENLPSTFKVSKQPSKLRKQEMEVAKPASRAADAPEHVHLPREASSLSKPGAAHIEVDRRAIKRHMREMDRDPAFKAAYDKETDPAERANLIDAWIVDHDLQHAMGLPQARIDAQLSQRIARMQGKPRQVGTEDSVPSREAKSGPRMDGKKAKKPNDQAAAAMQYNGGATGATTSAANKRLVGAHTTHVVAGPTPSQAHRLSHSSAARQADLIPTPSLSHETYSRKPAALNTTAQATTQNNAIAEMEVEHEHEEGYDPRVREGYVNASDQIKEWLSSQASPAPPNEIGPSLGSPKAAVRKRPSRKRVSQEYSDDNDDYANDDVEKDVDSEIETGVKKRSKKRSKKAAHGDLEKASKPCPAATSEDGPRGTIKGAWSDEEIALADSIFASSCSVSNISALEMRRKIVDWKSVTDFKKEMLEAFPLRTKAAIRKFCHRQYHPHNTGSWTEEEDAVLRKQVAAFGNDWVSVGEIVDRTAQACKDRWSKIVQIEDTMERGPWSVQDEGDLMEAVEESLETIRQHCGDEDLANDSERLEMMIDWNKISEKMQGRRSAKRCHEKWKTLGRRPPTTLEDTILQQSVEQRSDTELPTKQRRLRAAYAKLGWQDVLEALQEINAACAEVPEDRVFPLESTFWSFVGTKNANSKFPPKLRRRCYLELLEEFRSLSALRKASGIVGQARAMERELLRLKRSGQMAFTSTLPDEPYKHRRKRPAPAAISKETHPRISKPCISATPAKKVAGLHAARPLGATGNVVKKKKKHLSKERIDNSDDENVIDMVAGAEGDA